MIFTEFYTNLGINFEKKVDFNSAYLFSRGCSSEPLDPPPPATGVQQMHVSYLYISKAHNTKIIVNDRWGWIVSSSHG